jgi:hypothetical protein
MSRRIIPVLCALAVAVVPATALAQPAQDPSPAPSHGGVVYLPRAIAPAGTPVETPATPTKPVSSPTASNDDNTNGWQIAALAEAAVLAAFALGGAALVARRQHRAPHMGV